MLINNIPQELKALKQWVCWKLVHTEKGSLTKIPFNPVTGRMASVTDPSTWVRFSSAKKYMKDYSGIGFVLTQEDPFTIIDLDSPVNEEQVHRHRTIIEKFDSYIELSPSKRGVHIVVRGNVGKGFKRDKVEAYSSKRYMTFTGNVVGGVKKIKNHQENLDILVGEATASDKNELLSLNDLDKPEELSDKILLAKASKAENSVKFLSLWEGYWQGGGEYPSQSEADYALLSILCFYSKNNEQVRRLFRMSSLGARAKAVLNDKYLNRSILRIRQEQPPDIDPTELLASAEKAVKAPTTKPDMDVVFPPGLLGDIANYLYSSAIRPVKEIALAGAIGFMAGITGRAYNVSGSGLNLYLLLLAKTGTGKDAMASGINSLISSVEQKIPCAHDFLGPAHFASGEAMRRTVQDNPCFVSILEEFGSTLTSMLSAKAPAHLVSLKRSFLDMFNKSGKTQILRKVVYSSKDKELGAVRSPSVSLLCESEPTGYFRSLSEQHVSSGLMPRFITIQYDGERPKRNLNAFGAPPQELSDRLADLMETSLNLQHNETALDVTFTEEAMDAANRFDIYVDHKMNSQQNDAVLQMWNRAHFKVLKLAALIAVGQDFNAPVVTDEHVQWAVHLVKRDINDMLHRFVSGAIGSGYAVQYAVVKQVIIDYLNMPIKERVSKLKVRKDIAKAGIMPKFVLLRKLRNQPCFTEDRRGEQRAIDDVLRSMDENGELVTIGKHVSRVTYKFQGLLLGIGENWYTDL